MSYNIYDYIDHSGKNAIKNWATGLGADKAKFEAKVNMLRTAGAGLPPKLLANTRSPHIRKLRFRGLAQIQWRPMLCKGPVNNSLEFTLLLGAHEKGSKLVPPNADHDAEAIRQIVIANPIARRRAHERVT